MNKKNNNVIKINIQITREDTGNYRNANVFIETDCPSGKKGVTKDINLSLEHSKKINEFFINEIKNKAWSMISDDFNNIFLN